MNLARGQEELKTLLEKEKEKEKKKKKAANRFPQHVVDHNPGNHKSAAKTTQ